MPAAAEPAPTVLLCPTAWDVAQLARSENSGWNSEYFTYGSDAEHNPESFDADAFIRGAVEFLRPLTVAGVASSSDYPGCIVAAFVAEELGLPGPAPVSVLRCSHKYYSRLAQQSAVPEATPRFALIDPGALDEATFPLTFPMFVKPVKSWFSQYARRINSFAELRDFSQSPGLRWHLANFVKPFNQLLSRFSEFVIDGGYLLGEELLTGQQVTLEGYVLAGTTTVFGIVDSLTYENTPSFQRFDYPSSIDSSVAARMAAISERVMSGLGFRHGLFNIEFFHNQQTDQVQIIEINPRMCGQFADMMQMVDGTNTYELLLALARGVQPPAGGSTGGDWPGRSQAASSFVLRHFRDALLVKAPGQAEIAAMLAQYPVSVFQSYYQVGQLFSSSDYQFDGFSYRYAVANLFGPSAAAVTDQFEAVRTALDYELVDLPDKPEP